MKLFRPGIVTLILICTIGITSAFAQRDYRTGIGFRAGPLAGLSVKQFISNKNAIEVIYSSKWQGTIFEGLFEVHNDLFKSKSFNVYYGGGTHFGHWKQNEANHPWFSNEGNHSSWGIDGILGIEHRFKDAPISVSMDWKPMLNLIEYSGFWMNDIGLTIRFNPF